MPKAKPAGQSRPPRYGSKGDYRCGVPAENDTVCGQPVRTSNAWLCEDHTKTWRRERDVARKREQRRGPLRFYGTQSGWLDLNQALHYRNMAEQLVAGSPALLQKIYDAYAAEEPHTYRALREYDLLIRVLLELLPQESARVPLM